MTRRDRQSVHKVLRETTLLTAVNSDAKNAARIPTPGGRSQNKSHGSNQRRRGRRSLVEPFKDFVLSITGKRGVCVARLLSLLRQHGFEGSRHSVQRFLKAHGTRLVSKRDEAHEWMRMILQGAIGETPLRTDVGESFSDESIRLLLGHVLTRPLKLRNRALTLLAHAKGISIRDTAAFLCVCRATVRDHVRAFAQGGLRRALDLSRKEVKKADDPKNSEAVFRIIHAPPMACGFNRTSWRMEDLQLALAQEGIRIGKLNIREIIKKAGYKYRKAKKVLTSTDPDYRKKLERITEILGSLKSDEKFFSIDEFGPFAVKMQGGLTLSKGDEGKTIPQHQKSKGTLIVTGALELSTNQVTHFYSARKNTDEMIRMLGLLLERYRTQRRIYFSWDAASWHGSKKFFKKVDEVNAPEYRARHGTPQVELAPLPACAQFLNVIESVFSGMARAIIHNSDYQSVEECKTAIDRYLSERNDHFQKCPKRAGRKIWGKERVVTEFNASNNCKDPRW